MVVHLGIALDLALLVPAYLLAAVLLWRAVPVGYVLAAVMLVSGMLHQVSYMVALPFQAAAGVPGSVAFDPMEPFIALLYLLASALLIFCAGREGRELPRATTMVASRSSLASHDRKERLRVWAARALLSASGCVRLRIDLPVIL